MLVDIAGNWTHVNVNGSSFAQDIGFHWRYSICCVFKLFLVGVGYDVVPLLLVIIKLNAISMCLRKQIKRYWKKEKSFPQISKDFLHFILSWLGQVKLILLEREYLREE